MTTSNVEALKMFTALTKFNGKELWAYETKIVQMLTILNLDYCLKTSLHRSISLTHVCYNNKVSIDEYEMKLEESNATDNERGKFAISKDHQNRVYTFVLMTLGDDILPYINNVMKGYGYALWQELLNGIKTVPLKRKQLYINNYYQYK
jgi:hypothetical protein